MKGRPSFSATERATAIPPMPPVITSTPSQASRAVRVHARMNFGMSSAAMRIAARAPPSTPPDPRIVASTLPASAVAGIPADENIGARSSGARARTSWPAAARPRARAT